jgi:RNA recognition motif-containing protein
LFQKRYKERIVIEKVFVGNLPHDATEVDLKLHFEKAGAVRSAKIITHGKRHRSRCFGFIDMENADAAVSDLNGKDFGGRPLRVNKAWDREAFTRPHSGHRDRGERGDRGDRGHRGGSRR